MFYAEIDENSRCYHITENELPLSGRIVAVGENVFGMVYDPETGTFSEYIPPEPEPTPTPPLTEQEQIAIDTALNVEYMVCLMEANLG